MFSSSIDDINFDDIDVSSFTDALRDAGIAALIIFGSILLLSLIIGIVVARKAGYSGWWGAVVVLVPFIGPIVFVILALLKWPALKQRDEALRVLKDHGIPLPSQQRLAEREAENRAKLEADAQRRAEQARLDREKAERTRDEMRAQNQPAAVTATPAAASAAKPSTTRPATTGKTATAKTPPAAKPVDEAPASKEEPTKDA
jgi:hypothetical protein